MIHYLSTREHSYTIRDFLRHFGGPLERRVRAVAYADLRSLRDLPARATYLFTDMERLSPALLLALAPLEERLRAAGARVLNGPARTLRRFDLLRGLAEAQWNAHDAHRLDETPRRPIRFPVFLRGENDHDGSKTPLLRDEAALAEAVERAVSGGARRLDLLAVEFCDTRAPDGLFCKYGAFIVGERILPRHVFFERRSWVVKWAGVVEPRALAIERRYLAENPHRERLLELFRFARIDYGRIDYGLRPDGGIETFEINTNPALLNAAMGAKEGLRMKVHLRFIDAFLRALAEIDDGDPADAARGPRVEVPPLPEFPPAPPPGKRGLGWLARADNALGWLRGLGRGYVFRLLRTRG